MSKTRKKVMGIDEFISEHSRITLRLLVPTTEGREMLVFNGDVYPKEITVTGVFVTPVTLLEDEQICVSTTTLDQIKKSC